MQSVEPDKIYYFCNYTNAQNKLFYAEKDYFDFLKKYADHLVPILDTYAYCLLPNQFHWLVKIKSENEIFDYLKVNNRIPEETLNFQQYKNLSSTTGGLVANIFSLTISKQFSLFFNAYTLLWQKHFSKRESLFENAIKKLEILNSQQVKDTLLSIHLMPTEFGIEPDFEQWKFSSFQAYLSSKPSSIERNEALNLFDGKDNFVLAHSEKALKWAHEKVNELSK
jgi:hypothetical protein